MEPVDNAVRNGKDFKKDEKFVVWKRCNIHGGTVYKKRGTNDKIALFLIQISEEEKSAIQHQ